MQSPSAVIFEPPKIKSDTVSTVSSSICLEVMEPDAMILVFWMFNLYSKELLMLPFVSDPLNTYCSSDAPEPLGKTPHHIKLVNLFKQSKIKTTINLMAA